MENRVKKIHALGQSIWLDFIDRKIMDSGELQKGITDYGVRGVTSNSAIFAKAISSSADCDQDIRALFVRAYNEMLEAIEKQKRTQNTGL